MVFSGLFFMFVFLPLALGVYYLCPGNRKNLALFLISLLFYAWGEPVLVLIMLFSTVSDYYHGLLIAKYQQNKRLAKLFLISSLGINLGLLGFFKYTDFFLLNLNTFWDLNIPLLGLTLPIGISFYTFQTMSYSIDVYRGLVPAQKNFITFGAYVSLFPQLIAGPIVRYQTVAYELEHRVHTLEKFAQGIERFVIGLAKKVLLANNIGYLFSAIQGSLTLSMDTLSVATAWLGVIAFGLQIYFDFSGYSDMAIGLGKMLGFTFPENFNYPYISKSITEFWRRWHISLGTWFREYLYIPLGGNRVGKGHLFFNILVVWAFTGFWHGASWNFLLWGLYFGVILILEKTFLLNWFTRLPRAFAHLYTLVLLCFSWSLFAFEDVDLGLAYMGRMLGLGGAPWLDNSFLYAVSGHWFVLSLGLLAALPWVKLLPQNRLTNSLKPLVLAALLVCSVAYLVDSSYNPFLYFRF